MDQDSNVGVSSNTDTTNEDLLGQYNNHSVQSLDNSAVKAVIIVFASIVFYVAMSLVLRITSPLALIPLLINILFVSYLFKAVSKTGSYLPIRFALAYIFLLAMTSYLFIVGIGALVPSSYDSLAPIGIILAMILYGLVYYLAMYLTLRWVRKTRLEHDSNSDAALYILLETSLVFMRRISYIGVACAMLIPFLASTY